MIQPHTFFAPDELDCLVMTAAEFIAGHDPDGDLSIRQRELSELACQMFIDPGEDDYQLPPATDPNLTRVIVTLETYAHVSRTVTVAVDVPHAIAADTDAISGHLNEGGVYWLELAEHYHAADDLEVTDVWLGVSPHPPVLHSYALDVELDAVARLDAHTVEDAKRILSEALQSISFGAFGAVRITEATMNQQPRVFEIDGQETDAPRPYTVTGLLDLGMSPSPLYVAGVVEGERDTCDSDSNSGEYGEYQRYAVTVYACDADEAAATAEGLILDEDDEDDEEEESGEDLAQAA
ncbi:hypothetical protein ACQP2T_61620 [Nonomuraea sp. CA-143628]|uniref:hypothetical protein n=1 Tax=Nonomuraea sp. CA-143628 TaxID=3239997 RepID=UPI003D8DE3B4